MTPIKRSRRLRAGLAGLGVFSAFGAALGLGLPAHADTTPSLATRAISASAPAKRTGPVTEGRSTAPVVVTRGS
jgi:hypothetical protein